MKPFAWLAAPLVASVVLACSSSTPNRPPIDTSAGSDPGVGAGGGGAAVGGDSGNTASDAGTVTPDEDGSVEGGVCNSTNCTGCCDAVSHCQTGTTNAACGVSGGACTSCGTLFNCTNGTCT